MDKSTIIEMKNKTLEHIAAIDAERKQNEIFAKSCDDAVKSLVDEKVTRTIKYNSVIAQNASENPDVANPDDKKKAEENIRNCNIKVIDSENNLDTVKSNLEVINNPSLAEDKSTLLEFIEENIRSCEEWKKFSEDVIKGNYGPSPDAKNKDVVDTLTENVLEEADKVVEVEPYQEEKKEEVTNIDNFDAELEKELDQELEKVQDNISDIKEEANNLNEEITPIETPVVTSLEDEELSPSDIFNAENVEEEMETPALANEEEVDDIESGKAVKVVKVEEVGAPEVSQEEEKGTSRKLAA